MPEVSFDDGYKTSGTGEIVIDDAALNAQRETAEVSLESKKEPTKILADNSQFTTMYDGYGNKVETRYFAHHPNIDCVVITTSADGHREIVVYGQNGEHKTLPPTMLDTALRANAGEIAQITGIVAVEGDRQAFATTITQTDAPPEQPYEPIKMREFPQYSEPAASQEIAPENTAEEIKETEEKATEQESSGNRDKQQSTTSNLNTDKKKPDLPEPE